VYDGEQTSHPADKRIPTHVILATMHTTRVCRLTPAALLAVVTLAACGGSTATTQASPTVPPTTNPPTTTTAVTTTTAATTTTAVTTTAPVTIPGPALTAADLVLRDDGIGPLMFGDPADSTIAALANALGTPTGDDVSEYPEFCSSADDCTGLTDTYYSASDNAPVAFTFPLSREACFSNGLCTTFGGSDVKALAFVGWKLSCGWEECKSTPPLFTSTGMTLGSRWADFKDEMTEPVGCVQQGYSSTAGVALELAATTGELFAQPDFGTETTEVLVGPSPEVVVVYELWSGDLPEVLAYCAEFGIPEWVTAQ
jgi:hypothetical protein